METFPRKMKVLFRLVPLLPLNGSGEEGEASAWMLILSY